MSGMLVDVNAAHVHKISVLIVLGNIEAVLNVVVRLLKP